MVEWGGAVRTSHESWSRVESFCWKSLIGAVSVKIRRWIGAGVRSICLASAWGGGFTGVGSGGGGFRVGLRGGVKGWG